MGVEEVEKNAHIFQARVHTLSVKWHHGVCCVTEDDSTVVEVVGRAFDGYERQMRAACELALQVLRGDELWRDTGKVLREEGNEVPGRVFGEFLIRAVWCK